jgi:hypothetical protein
MMSGSVLKSMNQWTVALGCGNFPVKISIPAGFMKLNPDIAEIFQNQKDTH